MRRTFFLLLALLTLASAAAAQIGKRVSIRAGTPEDRAIREITSTNDAAQKLALLDKFLAEYGQGEVALVAYDIYMDHYLAAKDYAKVYDYGEKSLVLDPDAYSMVMRMFRAAQEQNDPARLIDYGTRIGQILQRFRARPAPEGTDDATWQSIKAGTLEENRDGINYVEYTVFSTAYQNQDPASKAGQMERFFAAFPDSQYAASAYNVAAGAYQQLKQFDQMDAAIEKGLAAQPDNVTLLLLAADSWNERGIELEKASTYAERALKALETAEKPATFTDEQWAQQKPFQQGLAHSITGQVQVRQNRNTPAVDALNAAAPLLKADPFAYSRNQYWLGFALINLKRYAEARTAFTQAAEADTPFRGPAQEKLNSLPAATRRRR